MRGCELIYEVERKARSSTDQANIYPHCSRGNIPPLFAHDSKLDANFVSYETHLLTAVVFLWNEYSRPHLAFEEEQVH